MIIFFGTRSRTAVLGQLHYVCARCHHHAAHTCVRATRSFTLFFVPLIPLGKTTIATCHVCRFQQSISNDHADQALAQHRLGPRRA